MATGKTMLGWCVRQYGANDVLRLEELPVPSLLEGEILVRISSAPINPHLPRSDVRSVHAQNRPTGDRLAKLLALVARGALKPQVHKLHGFAEAPAAYAASESQRSRGKNVITIP